MSRVILLILVSIVSFSSPASFALAQRARRPAAATPSRTGEPRAREEARRREQVLALVREMISDVGRLDDLSYRARLLALAADVLWNADQQEARAVFRRAWQAATASDRAAQEELTSEANGETVRPVTETRDEILFRIARRDTSLTEEFLQSLIAERSEANNQSGDETQATADHWRTPSPRTARALELAAQMLNEGQDGRASDIIRSLVLSEGVSADLIAFLVRLRERNHVAADDLFHTLITRTRLMSRERPTANHVLLLSSYVFSPQLLTVVGADGALQFRSIARAIVPGAQRVESLPPVAENARALFYQFAIETLQPSNSSLSSAEMRARYSAIERLLPFFEHESPPTAMALRAARDPLAAGINGAHIISELNVNSFASDRVVDPLEPHMRQLANERNALVRDRLRVRIVRTASRHKLWLRARAIAGDIEDGSLKRAVLSFIVAQQIKHLSDAYAEDDASDYESAAQFVSSSNVAPILRAWGLAQASLLAARRNNRMRALELALEAAASARQATTGTHEQVAALVVATSAMQATNRQRSWELLRETVRAVNATEDFAGDEIEFNVGGELSEAFAEEDFFVEAEAFRFDQIFLSATRENLSQAITEARIIEAVRPRSFAKLAIARAVLEPGTLQPSN
jgi:hypothetical protein